MALDASWLTATSGTVGTDVRVGFDSPSGTLTTGAGLQKFTAVVRRTAGSLNPTLDMYVYESGSSKSQLLTATSIVSINSQVVQATWNANLLTNVSGAGVECRIVGTATANLGALPVYSSAGTLFSGTATGAQNVNIPAHTAGDLLVLVALAQAPNSDGTVTSLGSGWTQLGGASNTYGSGITKVGIGWWKGNGADTTVSVTFGGTGVTPRFLARVFQFTATNGFATTAIANVSTANTGSGSSVSMPTVTPNGNNQRAICIIANSVSAGINSATGESGGDWTEAVAESTATGGMLEIQTSSQSGGGAISGGTAALGTPGVWVAVGFTAVPATLTVSTVEIGAVDWTADVAAGGQTIAAATGTVAVVGYVPALTSDNNLAVALGEVAVTGSNPIVVAPVSVVSTDGVLAVAGFAPTSTFGSNLTPAAGAVTILGYVPTPGAISSVTTAVGAAAVSGSAPSFSGSVPAIPGVGAVTVAGKIPIVSIGITLTPSAGTITVLGFAPTLSAGASAAPTVGSVTVVGFSPSLSLGNTLTSDVGVVTVLGSAPSVSVQGSFAANPGAGIVTVSGQAPAISVESTIATVLGAIATTGAAPIFAADVPATPSTGVVTALGSAPTVSLGTDIALAPTSGSIIVQGFASAIAIGANPIISLGSVTVFGQAPVISAGMTVATGVGTLAVAGLAPALSLGATLTPPVGAVALIGQPPAWAGTGAVTAVPGTGAVAVGLSAPLTIVASSEAFPTVGAAAIAGFAPSFSVRQDLQPGAGAVTILGRAPVVVSVFDITVTTNVGAIAVAGFAPTALSLSGSTPASGAVTLLGRVPIINARAFLTTGDARNITVQGFAPSFTGEVGTVSFPSASALNVIGFKPIVGRRPIAASAVIDLGTAKVDPGPNSGIIDVGIISTLKDRAA